MKFYSEKLGELFDTADDLRAAEAKHKKMQANKDAIMKEIIQHFDNCTAEIDAALAKVETISEVLTDKEEAALIHTLMTKLMDFTTKCSFHR